ncbi:MAG: hypothetical protein M0026_08830 [Nocardiopsaceae bacterium]|nr:hypothetical protein [Nocardiopsaceae bacterium]
MFSSRVLPQAATSTALVAACATASGVLGNGERRSEGRDEAAESGNGLQ